MDFARFEIETDSENIQNNIFKEESNASNECRESPSRYRQHTQI